MRPTGIVRRVDHLGRVVLPIKWRRIMGVRENDPIEIFVDGEKIVLKKFSPVCVLCGFPGEMTKFKGKTICCHCKKELLDTAVIEKVNT
jgi:transcriptional pleiotropic regulator of transition state genes